jgi:RNA polymerase sigma-70 factor (ECF subfamily)
MAGDLLAAHTDISSLRVTHPVSDPIPQVTTDELVGRAKDGDREAYSMLFDRFHDEIYRFAARRLGDPFAGQDVAADTFADVFGSIGRFQWRGVPFEAWLYTIARRRVSDHRRTRDRQTRPAPVDLTLEADDHALGVADAIDLRDLVRRLPDAERDVIELRFMEDLSVEQTALRLEKNAGAVRVAQHRAIARLRALAAEASAKESP